MASVEAGRYHKWGPEATRRELIVQVEAAILTLLLELGGGGLARSAPGWLKANRNSVSSSLSSALLGFCRTAPLRLRRAAAVLDTVHSLLVSGRHATPRELFYSNVALFKRQQQSDDVIKWLCQTLGVPRHYLRLVGTAKGLVRGHLLLFEPRSDGEDSVWVDGCDPLEPRGHSISPISAHVLRVESNASTVLVVEKETVFHRLLQEGVLEKHRPLILVTARGFPDLATRYFLRRICEDCADPQIVLLMDFDAFGLQIAASYAFGSEESWSQENLALPTAVPMVCPGGVAGAVLQYGLREGDGLPLSKRDRSLAQNLLQRLSARGMATAVWEEALTSLLGGGLKYELDSLEKLSELVANGIGRPHRAAPCA